MIHTYNMYSLINHMYTYIYIYIYRSIQPSLGLRALGLSVKLYYTSHGLALGLSEKLRPNFFGIPAALLL